MSSSDKEKRNLFIIITNSLQNDFIENFKNNMTEEDWKVNYELCEEKWMEYFGDKRRSKEDLNVTSFINWMKNNVVSTESREILKSYHKFLEHYKHRVHVDFQETKRLWSEDKLKNFITDLMKKGAETNESKNGDIYQFIHLRDWHDPSEVTGSQREESFNFGMHCIKGSHGAKFILPLEENIEKYKFLNQIINSNSLSSFKYTPLESILDTLIDDYNSSKEKAQIGIFGVITNVKVKLLTFELKVIYDFKKVYICGDLCAGFSNKGHNDGLKYMKNILGVKVYNEQKFRKKFNFPKLNY